MQLSQFPRIKWVGISLLAAILVFGGMWALFRPPCDSNRWHGNDDPRLTFDTIYRNVRPDVHYVGDEVCNRCHREMAEAYHQHPMARSLAPLGGAESIEEYGAQAHNPFDALGFRYEVGRSAQKMVHFEKRIDSKGRLIGEIKAEIPYALGSGTRGRSYLVNHDGFLFQSPISWYAGSQTWDLAPNYRKLNQHFNRPVPDECIYCHANRAEPIEGSLNHFRTPVFQGYAIGCERCHGPGELHVRRRENPEGGGIEQAGGVDDTIVNPERLDPKLRESVCQQCHLQAVVRIVKRNRLREDYRPGLPISEFVSFFVLPANQTDTKRAVGHVEQMYASRCFQESGKNGDHRGGSLGCLSCHDPHDYPTPEKKMEFYRSRCLTCHTMKSCAVEETDRRKRSPNDNCLECHMPNVASSNIAHTAITDHRIPRNPGLDGRDFGPKKVDSQDYPIVPFDQSAGDVSNPEKQRDLGVALIEFASKQPSQKWGRLALPLLDQSLSRWPDDISVLEAKG